jgi:hypothetical protein
MAKRDAVVRGAGLTEAALLIDGSCGPFVRGHRKVDGRRVRCTTAALTPTTGGPAVKAHRFRSLPVGFVNDLAQRSTHRKASLSGAFLRVFLLSRQAVPSFKQGPQMNQPSLQQAMSAYVDVKARCARIVTRLEAIATDPNATPADPRDLFIRLELLSYELRGATFRVR